MTKDNIDEYIRFVDAVVSAYVPDPNDNPEHYKLVTTYQVHSHSKSCQKCKNEECRYNFTKCTIVAVPLPKDLSEDNENEIMQQGDNLLCKVKKYIDENPKG